MTCELRTLVTDAPTYVSRSDRLHFGSWAHEGITGSQTVDSELPVTSTIDQETCRLQTTDRTSVAREQHHPGLVTRAGRCETRWQQPVQTGTKKMPALARRH
jgi:hypothetical protein